MTEDVQLSAPPLVASQEEALLRETVAAIVADFGHGYFVERAATKEPMQELWDALGARGFLGVSVPEAFGGGGLGLTELAIVLEELGAGGCPELFLVSQAIAVCVLERYGTPEQQERYLPPIATGAERFAIALTEPDAGSNAHRISTSARRDGDEWVLRGTKTFISGVDHVDHMLLVARTGYDEQRARGLMSLFVVPSQAAGLERQLVPTAVQAPESQWMLFFDDVRLPAESLIGVADQGWKPMFDGLNPERVMGAAISTGIARYALDKAARYACERVVWDVPIGAHQGLAHPLARAKIHLEVARHQARRAAALFDAGLPAGEASNMAKYVASEAVFECLDVAIQVHGGNGLALEYGLADLWGIVRLQRIAPVSSEMVLNYVAQQSLGLPRSY
jgi:alkylation response protein AidB-like acyl-CoA dehydrogenase